VKGEDATIFGVPTIVSAKLLVLLSLNLLSWRVSSEVPEMAVRGAVGGVKLAVYTVELLTIRRLDNIPAKYHDPDLPILRDTLLILTRAPLTVDTSAPLMYIE
jgi:hypothetical protein